MVALRVRQSILWSLACHEWFHRSEEAKFGTLFNLIDSLHTVRIAQEVEQIELDLLIQSKVGTTCKLQRYSRYL